MKRIIVVHVPVLIDAPKSVFKETCDEITNDIALSKDIWSREGHRSIKTCGGNTWTEKEAEV